ncbi:MAG TPA: ferritin-like domain-containing protein [Labilithrix sp.]|nr:ferritin-like domain-containing protein [Labilithrix sp.]
MYVLKRLSSEPREPLALTAEHEAIARPRKGEIRWEDFDASAYDASALDAAAELWSTRAVQEMHSLALFTELASQLQALGAPLDWSGAFARMIADEVRHTDLCLRMCEALGRPAAPEIDPARLRLLAHAAPRGHVRHTLVAAFCIGETVSGHMFRRALRAANVPLAREVVGAIVVDETFHGELGWELGALLMRNDGAAFEAERAMLAGDLPHLFRHYATLCCATGGPAWARSEREVDDGPNFGTLTSAGYARAFFDAMEADVVPGLVAIGLPEAEGAYATLLRELA